MSTPPSPDNDYQAPPAPALFVLTKAAWNTVLGSIGSRLRALEAKRTELQDLIDDLSFNGQARIDAAISPLIDAVRVDLVTLREAVAQAITDAADAATTVTAEVRARVTGIEGRVTTIETEFDRIVAGGVSAAKVTLAAIAGFAPTNIQTAIASLVASVKTLTDGKAPIDSPALTGNPTAPTAALGDNDSSIATTAFARREAMQRAYDNQLHYG